MGPEALLELTAKQASILRAAARLLKPGGRLVYATCSLLPEENETIIEAFLAQNPGWVLLDAHDVLKTVGESIEAPGPYLRLTPAHHNTDGFFAAVLARAT